MAMIQEAAKWMQRRAKVIVKTPEVQARAEKGDEAATVTFTPPEGSGLAATTWNRTGKGAEPFTFNEKGMWTVTLTFADNTTRTARINIQVSGMVIIVK